MSDYVKSISEVIQELNTKRDSNPKLVRDWRKYIPEDSKWFPGCPGDPFCKECDGRGYLRLEGLPVGHPYFGKIFLCDCTKSRVKQLPPMPPEEIHGAPEDPPFVDPDYEQQVFDTGASFREFANRKRG